LVKSKGERFPFLNTGAETFFEGNPATPSESYAAQLQSLAFVERWGYERLEACGVIVGQEIFSTGGAVASPVLSQLRADTLEREIILCRHPHSAFGAAILAAVEPLFGGEWNSVIQGMTHVSERYSPERSRAARYSRIYEAFRVACARRGFQ
jgi:sugar (pentulose or hexulose) kinase